MKIRPTPTRLLLLFGLTAIYALCFAAIKAGLPFAPPLLFGGLRALIGGVALLGLVIALRQPLLPPRRSWGWILALASTGITLAFGAMFLSPGRAGVGIASVLGNTQPLIVVVLAAIFLGEQMTHSKWLTLGLGLIGVTLISSQALAGPDAYGLSGMALALTASAGASASSVIFKRMGTPASLLVITAWQLILGSLPLLAISALIERDTQMIWNAQFVGLLLFLALIGTSFANAVWYWLIQRDEVGRLTMFFFLVPLFGLGIAALAFGERINQLEGIGSILTIVGIGVATWESHRADD